ncbi:Ig-like domain-containing protein, partial [Colwellia sp. Bg11-28]|uniref:Ig-like domain-containing protein n=1 Tax=Colwellia sp. Bg11-28 TaxID=2058305 RepID=UPI0012FEC356
ITVQVKDSNGNNVNNGGDAVNLTASSGTIAAVTDNNDGTYTAIYTSATTVGTATITGTLNSIVITDDASISLKNGATDAGQSVISANPTTLVADGTSTSTITVQMKDSNGNNVLIGGDTVNLTASSGTIAAVTDNNDGTYTATY